MNREKQIANFLLQIKAIKLEPANPFTWASGWKSPIYCDNRKTLSFPEVRNFIRDEFINLIKIEFPDAEVIAGVATGAIAHGALVADKMGLPFIYVRSSPKGHGLENLVEGNLKSSQKVVVIEDLISTGKSSIKAVEAIKHTGGNVLGLAAIFTYGFNVADSNFNEINCKNLALSNYDILIEQALVENYITETDVDALKNWRKAPGEWRK